MCRICESVYKMKNIMKVVTAFICIWLWTVPVLSHDHLKAEYVPWGVDEYELFGLSKSELAKDFKNTFHFNKEFTQAYLISETYGPRFLLIYDHDHIASVQRMFIDGCGCH